MTAQHPSTPGPEWVGVPLDEPKIEVQVVDFPHRPVCLSFVWPEAEGRRITTRFLPDQARALGSSLIKFADELAANADGQYN